MNKLVSLILVCIFLLGCNPRSNDTQMAVKVNDYVMSLKEFNDLYNEAKAIRSQTLRSKNQFIEEIITRKALLQEAQKEGLDKEEDFLKSIERLWEQSLITILLERKSNELAASVKVSDREIEDYYDKLPKEKKNTGNLQELKAEIKNMLIDNKERFMMDNWIKSVARNSVVEINDSLTDK